MNDFAAADWSDELVQSTCAGIERDFRAMCTREAARLVAAEVGASTAVVALAGAIAVEGLESEAAVFAARRDYIEAAAHLAGASPRTVISIAADLLERYADAAAAVAEALMRHETPNVAAAVAACPVPLRAA